MEKITQEKLQDALQNQDSFLAFYVDVEPVDLALAIENLDDDDIQKICQWLEDEPLSELIEDADDDLRLRLSSFIDDHRLLSVFNFMQKDDIVDIIGDLPTGRKKALINLMRSGDQKIIKELLKYPEESAGGIMTTSYIAIKANWTVAQSLQRIREIADKSEVIETLYVIDDTKRLIGEVDLRNMLGAQKAQRISTIMDDSVISVQPEVDQEQVARLVSRYDLTSIPVVNKRGAILGIITVDDVIDVIVEEYEEDMLQMAGVNREEDLSSTLSESIRMRLPWLMVNLLTAFLASFTVKMFQNTIEQVVALSATMTIVTGMGGNAGTQTMSILVRELAKREIPLKENAALIGKLYLENYPLATAKDIQKFFKTATDVLRLITAMSDGDISLATNTKFRSFKRKERRLLLELLQNCGSIEEDMLRYKNRWLRVGERLHPSEYSTEQFGKVIAAFNKLRNGIKIETFAGKVTKAIETEDFKSALMLLRKRPGELARKLDHLLRNTTDKNAVVNTFKDVASEVSTPVLLQVKEHFAHRTDKLESRVFFPKGNLARCYCIENTLSDIDEKYCNAIVKICENALVENYKSKDFLGNVYLSEEFKNYIVPFSQRSASKALKTIVRGSRLKIEDNTKHVLLFLLLFVLYCLVFSLTLHPK